MTPSKLLKFTALVLATTVLTLAVMIVLPQDKYLRYKALTDHKAPTAEWIYERIHYDRAPINIAFIGTSRTGMSIHTRRLEDRLASHGINVKAANLHVVRTGRNMHYAIAKELLETRKVDLLVLEITELEDRKPHPEYIYLADSADVVFAPLVINLNYFNDLVRLPGRQMDLFAQTLLNKIGVTHTQFSMDRYWGSNLDHAQTVTTEDGAVHQRDTVNSLETMEELRKAQEAHDTPPVFPKSLSWLEFRYPRLMMNRIIDLANAKGTKVVLLYLPRYGGPDVPPSYEPLFAGRVPLINPKPVLDSYRLWEDVPHVNWDGAQRVTDYVADAIAQGGYFKPDRTLQSDSRY